MIVVTGGAGFIGSNLVKYLNSEGFTDILIIDDVTDSRKLDTLSKLQFTAYRDVDSINWKTLRSEWIDKVFHIGGISSTTETDGKKLMEYNYTHTLNWSYFCHSQKIPLVYTSSASVYGNCETFRECDTLNPLNAYAQSKKLSERIPQDNTWIFRPFNVYGMGEDHKDSQMSPVSKFHKQFKETGKVTLFDGSDRIQRDFICVDDVVKILVNHTDKNPGTYNLGTGSTRSFLELAEMITDNIEYIPMPSNLLGKYQYYSKADTTKLRQNLIGEYSFITPELYYDYFKRVNARQP